MKTYFYNPFRDKEELLAEFRQKVTAYIKDGYSITLAAKMSGHNWTAPGVRKEALKDEAFYDLYIETLAKSRTLQGLAMTEAIERRGIEFVSKLRGKYGVIRIGV